MGSWAATPCQQKCPGTFLSSSQNAPLWGIFTLKFAWRAIGHPNQESFEMAPMARQFNSLPPFAPQEPRQAAHGAGHSVPNRVPAESYGLGVGGSRGKRIEAKELDSVLHRANFRRRLSWDASAASVLPSHLNEGLAFRAGFLQCAPKSARKGSPLRFPSIR